MGGGDDGNIYRGENEKEKIEKLYKQLDETM